MFSLSTLLVVVPLLSSLSLSAHATNIPHSHSLRRRTGGFAVPPTLLEKKDTLVKRQETCDVGLVLCTGNPTGHCCEGSCCGDGCCPTGYYCDPVGTQAACCQTGQVCNDTISGCTDSTLVECGAAYDFCCPAGQACGHDASGNATCGGVIVGGNNNGVTKSSSANTGATPTANNNGGFSASTAPIANTPAVNNPSTTTSSRFSIPGVNGAGKMEVGALAGVFGLVALAL